jgi:hypothetical protein
VSNHSTVLSAIAAQSKAATAPRFYVRSDKSEKLFAGA